MIRFLLDTDHFTLHERGHAPLRRRLAAIAGDTVATSVVTVEESLRGRPALLSRRLDGEGRIRAYAKLMETIGFIASIPVAPFDQASEELFAHLQSLHLRVGAPDLKIAAIGLAHQLVVVTRNRRDFERVPHLLIEDWSVE
jgi:tRNA(fMet)-specific endonuclease VapC